MSDAVVVQRNARRFCAVFRLHQLPKHMTFKLPHFRCDEPDLAFSKIHIKTERLLLKLECHNDEKFYLLLQITRSSCKTFRKKKKPKK